MLYDETNMMWYDYDTVKKTQNKKWYPSNLSPLYSSCHHDDMDMNATVALWSNASWTNFTGGIPTSLERTHQQWDLPNTWPPLVEIVVTALENVRKYL